MRAKEDLEQGLYEVIPVPQAVPKDKDVDIIVVPGLGTDPKACWGAPDPKEPFNWITSADGLTTQFETARIFRYAYASAWRGPYKIKKDFDESIVNGLCVALKEERELCSKSRPIIFIGHSMGGLVVAQALNAMHKRQNIYGDILPCVTGCMFFGVPFDGTNFTALPQLWKKIEDFRTGAGKYDSLLSILEPGFRNNYLRSLCSDFKDLARMINPGIQLFCFYEELDIDVKKILTDLGLAALVSLAKLPVESLLKKYFSQENGATMRLVDQASATCVATRDSIGLQVGHSDLVKFRNANDPRYAQLVLPRLRELVDNSRTHARKRLIASGLTSMSAGAVDALRTLLSSYVNNKHRNALAKLGKNKSWMLKERSYQEWENLSARGVSCFWLTGPGGIDKTSISLSAVANIEETNLKQVSKSKHVPLLAFFLCDTTPLGSSPLELLKALLVQLINQNPLVADYAKHLLAQGQYLKDDSFSRQDSSKTSKMDIRATISLQNLWNCLGKVLENESFGDIYIIVDSIHLLARDQQSELLINYIYDYVARSPEPGSASCQGKARRWLFTSAQRGGRNRFEQLMRACHVVDLTSNEYKDKIKNSLEEYSKDLVEKLHQEKKYKRDQLYMIHDRMKMNGDDKRWIAIQYIRLRALPPQSSSETITKILSPTNASDLTSLVRYCWQAIIQRDPDDEHNLKTLLKALALAFRPLSISELSILSDIIDEDKVKRLIQKCEPMLQLVSEDQNVPRVEFSDTTLKVGFLWESAELVRHSPEGVLDDTQGQAQLHSEEEQYSILEDFHGVLAMRCFSFMERCGVKSTGTDMLAGRESPDTTLQDAENSSDRTYFGEFWILHAIRGKPELAKYIAKDLQLFWASNSSLRAAWLKDYLPLKPSVSDGSSHEGMTALHTAAFFGYDLLLEELIRSGHKEEIGIFNKDGHTPLHIASKYNNVKAVQVLLSYTKEDAIDMAHGDNGTALHAAAIQGHIETLKLLLDNDADPNAFCKRFGPVVNAAILSGNNDAVTLLLSNERHNLEAHKGKALPPLALSAAMSKREVFKEILTRNEGKWTAEDYHSALFQSCFIQRPESIEILRDIAPKHVLDDDVLHEAMFKAAVWDNWDCVSIVFNIKPKVASCEIFYLAAVTKHGGKMADDVLHNIWAEGGPRIVPREVINAALYQATDNQKAGTVEWLLNFCHADPNATDQRPTVLHPACFTHAPEQLFGDALTAAAWDGSYDIVKMLLQRNATVDSSRGCALQMAAQEGHAEVVRLLLLHGAKTNRVIGGPGAKPDYHGPEFPEATALQAACRYDRVQVVEVLLLHTKEPADPNLGGGIYERPIFAATRRTLPKVLKLLLAAPTIDVNVVGGRDLSTPLINAASFMSVEDVEALIKAGANVNQVDGNGDTAVIHAARRGDVNTLKLLIAHDASILHESRPEHKFAFQIAAEHGHIECIQVLAEKISAVCRALNTVAVGNSSMRNLLALPEGDDYRFADIEEINHLKTHAQDLQRELDKLEYFKDEEENIRKGLAEAEDVAKRCIQERLEAVRARDEDKSIYDQRTEEYERRTREYELGLHGYKALEEENEELKAVIAARETEVKTMDEAHSAEKRKSEDEKRNAEAAQERQEKLLKAEISNLKAKLEALERPAESPSQGVPVPVDQPRPSISSHSASHSDGDSQSKQGSREKMISLAQMTSERLGSGWKKVNKNFNKGDTKEGN
ncbi:hypothetical protein MCOR25_001273 [Pyricularia grisea]|nr:hypothetical protein MCOR25_001273 [Pyricularia grisea]